MSDTAQSTQATSGSSEPSVGSDSEPHAGGQIYIDPLAGVMRELQKNLQRLADRQS